MLVFMASDRQLRYNRGTTKKKKEKVSMYRFSMNGYEVDAGWLIPFVDKRVGGR